MAEAMHRSPYLILTGIEKEEAALLAQEPYQRIELVRLVRGLDQRQFASAIEVSHSLESHWERNTRPIKEDKRQKIVLFSKIRYRVLFGAKRISQAAVLFLGTAMTLWHLSSSLTTVPSPLVALRLKASA